MEVQRIESRTSTQVKAWLRLRDSAAARREEGAFFAEGLRLCTDLVSTCLVRALICTQRAMEAHPQLAVLGGGQTRRVIVSESVAEKLSDTHSPQGVFAVLEMPVEGGEISGGSRCLVLENVQDPSNVGALARSAAAFGFEHLILCGACADPFSPKALRASMGGLARLRLHRMQVTQAAGQLRAAGVPLYAAALQNSRPLGEFSLPEGTGVAVMIGNEGNGLSEQALCAADAAVRIPITGGVESLNASVAGGVLLWHFRRDV